MIKGMIFLARSKSFHSGIVLMDNDKNNLTVLKLENYIESIPDFPKPGTLFYDLSPLIESPQAWKLAIDKLCKILEGSKINMVYGIEARGFLVASAVALKLGIGMQMVRKKGKLPGATVALTYDLEYGTDTIEIQNRPINYNNRVAVVDDVLATGGTMRAAIDLLSKVSIPVVCCATIIELPFLKGRERLNTDFDSLLTYDGT